MQSCLYEGRVWHRRTKPLAHAFTYRVFFVCLDLGELPGVFDGFWLWSARGRRPAWFRREDHLGPGDMPLDQAVRELVETKAGFRPGGRILLLTHLRYWGVQMNPVSFYYCLNAEEQMVAVVAEVHNTPWGEEHCYVLDLRDERSATAKEPLRQEKEFHVSPFMGMDVEYLWRIGTPGERLQLEISNRGKDGEVYFRAGMELQRREIRGWSLASALVRYPCVTAKVWLGIYLQAWRLWRKGVPYHPHPKTLSKNADVAG
ncbi:MAG: DUF1365 domain-containing protein [Planctomycetales bacterium]